MHAIMHTRIQNEINDFVVTVFDSFYVVPPLFYVYVFVFRPQRSNGCFVQCWYWTRKTQCREREYCGLHRHRILSMQNRRMA